jgi:hypothetical protein
MTTAERVRCGCCSHIWRDGKPGNEDAAYLWHAEPSGNVIPLCVDCCAYWRLNAVDDPDLLPSLIESIPAAPVDLGDPT